MSDFVPATPISPLRQRLIDDMNMRRFSREMQRNYIRNVGRFATFLGRAPNTATAEDLRRFQVDQREAGVPVPTMSSFVSALRFFFTHTLDRPDLARRLVRVTHPRKAPVVLSTDEVGRLLNATTCLKHQAALSVAYGAGLRVAEVSCLKVSDIDSERMLLRIERGKGGQYRNAMLSTDMLALLRQWWKVGRQQGVMHPKGWLFPGQHAGKPISTRQLHRIDRAILLGSGYWDDDGGFARADLVPSALMGRPNQNVLWSQRRRRNAEVSGRFGIESSRFLRREAGQRGSLVYVG